MATVQELLQLIMEPPETGVPDTIYDDLNTSYTEEVSGLTTAAETSANEYEQALAAKDAEISRLKAANYDLLIASQSAIVEDDEGDTGDAGEADDAGDEDDENISIDDLYKNNDEDDEGNDDE